MAGFTTTASLIAIGTISGVLAGLFGIGGGVILVPALIFFLGFSQPKATGTSLAVLLPPLGLAAVLEYLRHDFVDLRAALIIAPVFIGGAWAGAKLATILPLPVLRLGFGIFILLLGAYLILEAAKTLGWL